MSTKVVESEKVEEKEEVSQDELEIIFLRTDFYDSQQDKYFKRPVGSVGIKINKDEEKITLACAFCHPKDCFSYRVAQDKVKGRLKGKTVKGNYKTVLRPSLMEHVDTNPDRSYHEILQEVFTGSQFFINRTYDQDLYDKEFEAILKKHKII